MLYTTFLGRSSKEVRTSWQKYCGYLHKAVFSSQFRKPDSPRVWLQIVYARLHTNTNSSIYILVTVCQWRPGNKLEFIGQTHSSVPRGPTRASQTYEISGFPSDFLISALVISDFCCKTASHTFVSRLFLTIRGNIIIKGFILAVVCITEIPRIIPTLS